MLSGVSVPNGAIVGTGRVVKKSVPAMQAVVGTPARVLGPILNILPLRKIWPGLVELVRCNVAGPLKYFSGTDGKNSASHSTLRPFRHVACARLLWGVFLSLFPLVAFGIFRHRESVNLSLGRFFEVVV